MPSYSNHVVGAGQRMNEASQVRLPCAMSKSKSCCPSRRSDAVFAAFHCDGEPVAGSSMMTNKSDDTVPARALRNNTENLH